MLSNSEPKISRPVTEENPSLPKPTKRQRFARFFVDSYPNAHLLFPLAACVLTLIKTSVLIAPVLNRSGDNMYHLLNEYAILHGVLGGDNPLGPVAMEFGQPVLRFYQSLFYLLNVGGHLLTTVSLKTLHNLTIVVCFALSPFTYMYCLRKLGLNRFAAGIGSMASMLSIAAFGNSFEAYHQAGIVTQSMGGLFFPWFMGHFVGMLRGENRASSTALLFALAFVSHAIMAVFAAFSGALYFLVASSSIRKKGVRRLIPFCLLGIALVSYWVLPFIEHTEKKRPVPDSIIRSGVHWFTSVSKDELTMVLFTGRLLDDPPRKGDARNENDKLMDRISIIHAIKTRPPAVSVLTGIGLLVALFTIRRTSHRFLVSGFLFSLFLFAGPDDYPWLRYLPFMKNIQTFRCTYLVEFFAFGLVGIGMETFFRRTMGFLRRRRRKPVRIVLLVFWILLAAAGIGLAGAEILILGNAHVVIRDPAYMDTMIDACSALENKGRPFRIMPKYKGRYKLRQGWFAVHGYQPYCTHWKGTGPTAAFNFCSQLGNPMSKGDLHALAGARYFSGTDDEMKSLINAKDSSGAPLFERLPNGSDRFGKPTDWHYLLDTGRDHFLRPLVGKPFPAVVNHSQWMWLAKSWTQHYANYLWEEETPISMRVEAGELKESGLLDAAPALLYLDHSGLDRDMAALKAFAEKGGIIISQGEIPGVPTVAPGDSDTSTSKRRFRKSFWDLWPFKKSASKIQTRDHREELDPGVAMADITALTRNSLSIQRFAYDIDVLRPLIAILPMQAVPGWRSFLDGEPAYTFAAGPDMVGVYIPEGAHRLVFKWELPMLGLVSLLLTLISLAIVLSLLMPAAVRRIRSYR
jgi:hypothetical protein